MNLEDKMSLRGLFLVTFRQFVSFKQCFDLEISNTIYKFSVWQKLQKESIFMGLINKLFGGSSEPKEEKVLPWIPLSTLKQLESISEKSKTKTQVIFKHSTRCGISRMVMNQFIEGYELNENDLDLYYLDLLNYRDVSNEVGYKFQVMHQSPQLLVIRNGVVVAHDSHGAINGINLNQFV